MGCLIETFCQSFHLSAAVKSLMTFGKCCHLYYGPPTTFLRKASRPKSQQLVFIIAVSLSSIPQLVNFEIEPINWIKVVVNPSRGYKGFQPFHKVSTYMGNDGSIIS